MTAQIKVENSEIEVCLIDYVTRGISVRCMDYRVAAQAERASDSASKHLVVFDEQERRCHRVDPRTAESVSGKGSMGSVMRVRAPPVTLLISIVPPSRWIEALAR